MVNTPKPNESELMPKEPEKNRFSNKAKPKPEWFNRFPNKAKSKTEWFEPEAQEEARLLAILSRLVNIRNMPNYQLLKS